MNRRERPKVLANFALSADGKVSTRAYSPANFTSKRDKERLLEIRALGDALLVGARTLAKDTMRMTLPRRDLQQQRLERGMAAQPLRVIVSHSGKDLYPDARVFQSRGAKRIVFTTSRMPAANRRALEPLCDLHVAPGRQLDIADVLRVLRRDYRVRTLVCEGGPTLLRSLVEADALDVLYITMAPVIFGGKDAPTLLGTRPDFLPSIVNLSLDSMQVIDGECYLRYRVIRN